MWAFGCPKNLRIGKEGKYSSVVSEIPFAGECVTPPCCQQVPCGTGDRRYLAANCSSRNLPLTEMGLALDMSSGSTRANFAMKPKLEGAAAGLSPWCTHRATFSE